MYCLKLREFKLDKLNKIAWILASGIVSENVWLAGGSLRTLIDEREEISDFDLFFKDQYSYVPLLGTESNIELIQKTRDKLNNLGFKLTFECPEGKLFTHIKNSCDLCGKEIHNEDQCTKGIKVQLICENFYQSPEELLSTFDLTPCLFATDGVHFWTYKSAIKSVKKKICELWRLTYPVSTIKRLIKYANKGYNVNAAIVSIVGNLMSRENILTSDEMRAYID